MSEKELNILNFISGGLAGIVAKSLSAPIDRVKIFYQVSHKKFTYKNFLSDILNIYHKEGLIYFWRGNIPSVLRAFPYSSI
jgi:hypothetical protein